MPGCCSERARMVREERRGGRRGGQCGGLGGGRAWRTLMMLSCVAAAMACECGPHQVVKGGKQVVFPVATSGCLFLWYRPEQRRTTINVTLALNYLSSNYLEIFFNETMLPLVTNNTQQYRSLTVNYTEADHTTRVSGVGSSTFIPDFRVQYAVVESDAGVFWINCTCNFLPRLRSESDKVLIAMMVLVVVVLMVVRYRMVHYCMRAQRAERSLARLKQKHKEELMEDAE